ncbi:MAG: prenyltransferase/squalene oxidase repeat-containing protein, partial [Planctomycetota bacterium]
GLDFVLDSQQESGLLVGEQKSHGPMYGHCIAALLLSEVSGMVDPARQERIDAALGPALKLILAAQQVDKARKHAGGWRYQPRSTDSDISCSGWALLALRSARGNGAAIPSEVIEKGIEYILRCRHASGGFCYMPGREPGLARTGTGMLCLELLGRHDEPETREAGEWILSHLPQTYGKPRFFCYGMYYASQGMFQRGGEAWQRWAEAMYKVMLAGQREDGSWPASTGTEAQAGEAYATAMAVLAMTVSYRQLPIYQR